MTHWHNLISQLPFEWAHYAFMQNALLAVILLSPMFAMLGCLVVNSQMAFFSEAVGHAALTGIAIGVLVGLTQPLGAMLVFAVALALAVTGLRRSTAASVDTIIGLTMAFTVALGVVLLSRGGGFAKFTGYLVGDLLTVTPRDLGRVAVLACLFFAVWVLFFNKIFFLVVNRSLAGSRGLPVWLLESLFAVTVALVVTASIPMAGLLVINSLLILPAATARNVARNMFAYLWIAVAVSLVSGLTGLIVSFYWATATGATIVLLTMVFFVLSLFGRRR